MDTLAGVAMMSREAIARAQARVGTVLRGKYRVDKVLGVGGMAVVYEVTHRNQKRFALKMLHVELSMHEDVRRRFLREGYAANTVDHPGAVVVIDDETAEDGAAFIVMELLDGRPLDELLAQNERHLPPEAVLAAAEQMLDVLVPAHAKGIVHRDIKPANLFVLRDGTLKVLDFGIARLHDLAGSSQATHTGVMLGTPAYMPPEQALSQAKQIDAQTDLWSVGATMFTLLSGANVHQGETATQILVAAATKPARSVTSIAPFVDERIAGLVAKGVAFEKSDRFASAAEMRDAVRKVHEEVFGGPPSRASLAALIVPGQRMAANPDPFIVSDAVSAPSPQAAVTVQPGAAKGDDLHPISSPLAESVSAVPSASGVQQSSVAFSTANPVSSASSPPGPGIGRRRGRAPWIVVAAVLIGTVGLFVSLRGGTIGSTAGIAPVATVTSTPIATETAVANAAPSASAPTPETTSTSTSSSGANAELPLAPRKLSPPASRRTTPPAGATGGALVSAQTVPSATAPSASKVVNDAGDLVLQRK
jgi:eukaryotic-like serine/threonine-protein kinase